MSCLGGCSRTRSRPIKSFEKIVSGIWEAERRLAESVYPIMNVMLVASREELLDLDHLSESIGAIADFLKSKASSINTDNSARSVDYDEDEKLELSSDLVFRAIRMIDDAINHLLGISNMDRVSESGLFEFRRGFAMFVASVNELSMIVASNIQITHRSRHDDEAGE